MVSVILVPILHFKLNLNGPSLRDCHQLNNGRSQEVECAATRRVGRERNDFPTSDPLEYIGKPPPARQGSKTTQPVAPGMIAKLNLIPTRPELSPALQAAMFADGIDDFVDNCQKLLRSAMPVHSLCVSFGQLDQSSPRLIRDTLPIRPDAEYIRERYLLLNPSRPFLQQNCGAQQSVLAEQLRLMADPDRESYLQRFQHHEGWSKYAEIYFWNQQELQAIICVRRSASDADFTPADLRFLAEVREALAPAIHQLYRWHQERVLTNCLQQVLADLPIPLLILNWDLEPESINTAARHACAEWRHGSAAARAFKPSSDFGLPAEILARCERQKAKLQSDGFTPARTERFSPRFDRVEHPTDRRLSAHIEVVRSPQTLIGRPHFAVRFQTTGEPPATAAYPASPGGRRLAMLSALSVCEREIALMVAEGLSNQEIALRLSREVATVKMHLRSVFRKLNATNRTRVAALLAGG